MESEQSDRKWCKMYRIECGCRCLGFLMLVKNRWGQKRREDISMLSECKGSGRGQQRSGVISKERVRWPWTWKVMEWSHWCCALKLSFFPTFTLSGNVQVWNGFLQTGSSDILLWSGCQVIRWPSRTSWAEVVVISLASPCFSHDSHTGLSNVCVCVCRLMRVCICVKGFKWNNVSATVAVMLPEACGL